ncbi:glycoside hydrolase family 32 protein [Paenibacillus borealis]|uniref:Glycoside hydrolase n=1 Tax=Paenibacillus borealis TaxID=160799 RepID=A0A089LNQ3_PAEBO|nr:glycoside hydrolase family 32 protein [Paenibacillus borealis]AIQ60803.1 glycoside hydrolase [Paenibacillus borealis]
MERAKYRPILHFTPKQHWLNDPNGLIYFEGEYHLFYQYHPHSSIWGPMHWGHAVSKDLITWEELDIALYPDEHGYAFSGSAVVDWNNTSGLFPEKPGIVAVYTSHLEPTEASPSVQRQSLAYSQDNGRTWIKYAGNPVLTHPSKADFRDPKVFWSEAHGKWVMVLATDQTITFYSSPNLRDWRLESEFGEGAGSHDAVWECPDLFQLPVEGTGDSKWVLLVSIGDNSGQRYGSRTQYFVGEFDGSVFTPEHSDIRWLDYGKDNYAGVSFSGIPAADGRRIFIGWMNNWRYANHIPSQGWRGAMTVPRVLTLHAAEGRTLIRQQPVAELDRYFAETAALPDMLLTPGEHRYLSSKASAMELRLELENNEAEQFGLIIHHTDTEHTELIYSAAEGILALRRDQSGETGFSEIFPDLQSTGRMGSLKNLRILLDACSVEVFANDGLSAITSLVFPGDACTGLTFYSTGGSVQLRGNQSFIR